MYGAWNEAAYRADRVTVVVGPDGRVRYVVHNDSGTVRDQDELLLAVRGISSDE
jgi:alkyl hydroperoxide reductase subunit AhpC